MNTKLTKSGTIPQYGLDRISYIRKILELVQANPHMEIAVYERDGAYLYTRTGLECGWAWNEHDYGLYPEPPKIQLRLPMYVKTKSGRLKTVLTLDQDKQQIVLPATLGTQHCVLKLDMPIHPDTTYSHDGINWQPFTGNEVI